MVQTILTQYINRVTASPPSYLKRYSFYRRIFIYTIDKREEIMIRKEMVIGISLLLLGTCTIPSGTSEQTSDANIITVDDEPGDADFTSIKEAVNSSSPGDTIEVYSGIYREDGIRITKENLNLRGISHELGVGDDSEKPFIKPDGTATVIIIEASHVLISNFRIEKISSSTCITLGADEPNRYQNNNTISDCSLINPYGSGIYFNGIGRDINIMNNTIYSCNLYGIFADSLDFRIQGNEIIDIDHNGIAIQLCRGKNISYNKIESCETGIHIYQGDENIIYGNDIRSCHTGIFNADGTDNIITGNNIELCPIGFFDEFGGGNHITNNNFQECWYILPWFKVRFLDFLLNRDTWNGNYWEFLRFIAPEPVTSPKIIPGILFIGFSIAGEIPIVLLFPWIALDRQTALEPYDLPGMS
jgi:parallel beta-helix repeat protein